MMKKKPRTLNDLRDHPWVTEVSDERSAGDGIWVYLKKHQSTIGTHVIHEDTVKDVLRYWPPEPCTRETCESWDYCKTVSL